MKSMLVIPGIAGLFLIGYGIRTMLSDSDEQSARAPDLTLQPCPSDGDATEKKRLDEICHLWEGTRIPLAKLAPIWRDVEDNQPEEKRPRPKFIHPEIDAFFAKHVEQPIVKGRRRLVVEKLLLKLDLEGDCPSVVGYGQANNDEKERKYSKNCYDYLATVPLWKHSLNVAEQLISKLAYKVMIPDALIMALGHDIGKIPAQYRATYTQADHPEISVLVLNSYPEYLGLNNHAELSKIIKSHHYIVQNTPMATSLKTADQDARKLELSGFVTEDEPIIPESASTVPADPMSADPPQPGPQTTEPASSASPPPPPKTENPPLLDEGGKQAKYIPQEIPLPEWLDLDAVLSSMEKFINVVEKTPDLKLLYHAVSVKEGFVWVKDEFLWKTINDVAGVQTDLVAASADEAARRNWLYSVVRELVRRGKVAVEFMKEGFYLAPCSIITIKGRSIPGYMIPFYAAAFGQLPSDLEKRKGSQLYKMVTQIVPKYQREAKQ